MPLRLFFFLMLLPTFVKSQKPDVKTDTVSLKPFKGKDSLVFDLNDAKLYFEMQKVEKYLKNYKGSNLYAKQGVALLLKALKKSGHKTFVLKDTILNDLRTGYFDTVSMHNKYLKAIDEIVPVMILAGDVMIHDGNGKLIRHLLITRWEDGNFIGAFTEFAVFSPDKRRLFAWSIYH